jgi:hypothetical protein
MSTTEVTKNSIEVQDIAQTHKAVDDVTFQKLDIDHINISFKVIGDLKEGSKLKIVDCMYLAEDNSYIQAITRQSTGQNRDKIMDFLDHLFLETKRNTEDILEKIRGDVDVDNNVSVLENLITNMVIFLHRYDIMKSVYRSDSGTYSRLGIIRNKFFTFRHSLFRNMAISR